MPASARDRVLFSGQNQDTGHLWVLVQRRNILLTFTGKITRATKGYDVRYRARTLSGTASEPRIQQLVARARHKYRPRPGLTRHLCQKHLQCTSAKPRVRVVLDPRGKIPGYTLDAPHSARRRVLLAHVRRLKRTRGFDLRTAARKIKGRLNVLRNYNRYKHVRRCKAITADMRFLDTQVRTREGLRWHTTDICGHLPRSSPR